MRRFESSRPSQAVRAFDEKARLAEKGRHSSGLSAFGKVSEPQIQPWVPPSSRKSLADNAKITVLERLRSETWFDPLRPNRTLSSNLSWSASYQILNLVLQRELPKISQYFQRFAVAENADALRLPLEKQLEIIVFSKTFVLRKMVRFDFCQQFQPLFNSLFRTHLT